MAKATSFARSGGTDTGGAYSPAVPTEVLATSRAEQQIAGLRNKQAKAVDQFLDDLASRGCGALLVGILWGS